MPAGSGAAAPVSKKKRGPGRQPRSLGVSLSPARWASHCATLACRISVFSTGQRASSALLDQTAKFFRMLKQEDGIRGGDENILKKNNEQLFTRGDRPDDMRRMFSYPSPVAGLKGVGGKVIIMEEASRLDEARPPLACQCAADSVGTAGSFS